MALITLKDVGKIYVSEKNVTVGIRGVNLSFDRGEFVAITGKSGSGKSTLLNVISGMDSYEEGDLLIEGQSTAHYLQPDWEEYREKYVSFIFQDYNIIESFTVLQNVELSLMHIEDKKERRRRALELIDRVGLRSHVKHKGSRLSGGQKQRTVIARALAKDSPIILADEPTGNLDSATSREILQLLYEVSKDKLLLIVTHNFDQVAPYATRHVRVFDGAVESDHVLSHPTVSEDKKENPQTTPARPSWKKSLFNGITLGKAIFAAKPKLSLFLCFLMILGSLGLFAITSSCRSALDLFQPHYMFHHIEGRLVLTTRNGAPLSLEEVKKLAEETHAESYLRFDFLLDDSYGLNGFTLPTGESYEDYQYLTARQTYGKNYGNDILGRYPEKSGEVLLYLPISYQPTVGKDALKIQTIQSGELSLNLVGVKYYYDNNLTPECLFTEEGFRTATAVQYLLRFSDFSLSLNVSAKEGTDNHTIPLYRIVPAFDMTEDKIYVSSRSYEQLCDSIKKSGLTPTASLFFTSTYQTYDYYYESDYTSLVFEKVFTQDDFTQTAPKYMGNPAYDKENAVFISDRLLRQIAEEVLEKSYRQASLFFASDEEARDAAQILTEKDYIAVPSDTTYQPDALTAITGTLSSLMMALVWGLTVMFLAFFIHLCSGRSLSAFKTDMAIMRSMGIGERVIRLAMYVRMVLSLIPSLILLFLVAILIFTNPQFNQYFDYLYPWQYALIVLGMVLLTLRITYKQIYKLFHESVKKSLKGGADQ